MILSFGDDLTRDIFAGTITSRVRRYPGDLLYTTRVKLYLIHTAKELRDVSNAPGNRLEKLKGQLSDFYSIRINAQFRIIFRFTGEHNAEDVSIVDYHCN